MARGGGTGGATLARLLDGVAWGLALALVAVGVGVADIAGAGTLPFVAAATAATVALWWWRPALVRWPGVLAIGVTLLALLTDVAWPLARRLVRDEPVDVARVDAIVVYSGASTRDGLLSGEALDRLLHAYALRARRPALPVLTSTVRQPRRDARGTAGDQRALARLADGAPPVIVPEVHSTYDESLAFADTARARGWRRVIVVTSPFHTRRACATLARRGLAVTCVAAPWRLASLPPRTPGERLLVLRRALYEGAAWVQYRAGGWAHWDGR